MLTILKIIHLETCGQYQKATDIALHCPEESYEMYEQYLRFKDKVDILLWAYNIKKLDL